MYISTSMVVLIYNIAQTLSSKVFPYFQDPLYFYNDAHLHLYLNFTDGIFSNHYIMETNTRKF